MREGVTCISTYESFPNNRLIEIGIDREGRFVVACGPGSIGPLHKHEEITLDAFEAYNVAQCLMLSAAERIKEQEAKSAQQNPPAPG